MIDEKRNAPTQAPNPSGVEFHPGDMIKVIAPASRFLGWTGRVGPADGTVVPGKILVLLELPSGSSWPFPIRAWMEPAALELVSRYKKPRLELIKGGRDEQAGKFDALL
jgi:hypothetical protein